MSVLIKGMKMPKNCVGCPFFEDTYKLHGCHANPKSFFDSDMWDCFVGERPSWCPIIELPPHGRLIEADALSEHIVYFPMDGGHLPVVYASYLTSAPTIIEAEVDE